LAEAKLTSIGLPGARAETIRAFARAVRDGQIRFEGIVEAEHFMKRLCEIPGIGKWTAQYVAMRALGEPDALPGGDLGLMRALGLESARELEPRSETWRPWRAYAAMYLWIVGDHDHANRRKKRVTTTSKKATEKRTVEQKMPIAV
jgi:DNA-3-methyladenine glycosylase II